MEWEPNSPFYYDHDWEKDFISIEDGKVITVVIFKYNGGRDTVDLPKFGHPFFCVN